MTESNADIAAAASAIAVAKARSLREQSMLRPLEDAVSEAVYAGDDLEMPRFGSPGGQDS